MKRLRLKHQYHDARLRRIRFEDRRVVFEVSLDGHWNKGCPEDAWLAFEIVHNLDEIRVAFNASTDQPCVEVEDEIIGVARLTKTRYLVDLQSVGSVEIDCRAVSEI